MEATSARDVGHPTVSPAPVELALEPPSVQAVRFLEALRPLLESIPKDNTPKDRGKRLPMMRPELFDGTYSAFRQWWEKLLDYSTDSGIPGQVTMGWDY